jgi:hypothetical protein
MQVGGQHLCVHCSVMLIVGIKETHSVLLNLKCGKKSLSVHVVALFGGDPTACVVAAIFVLVGLGSGATSS